jgi:hypothetical protein
MHEETKRKLNSGNACYHSVQSLLPSACCLLSRNVKVVLYGCETWSPTLREEHRLRVFENRGQRRIFAPEMDEVTGEWNKLHMICIHNQSLLGRSNQEK